jgi:hypothetical protein
MLWDGRAAAEGTFKKLLQPFEAVLDIVLTNLSVAS